MIIFCIPLLQNIFNRKCTCINGTQYMCIDFDGHHSDGSSFVYVNDFCYYRNCLYTHRYKFNSEKEQVNEIPSI